MATQSGKIVLSLEPVRRLAPAPPAQRRSPGDTPSAVFSQVYSCNGSRSALQRTLGNQASRSILADGCSTLAADPAPEVRAQRDFLWRMRTLTLRQSIGNRAFARLLARTPPSSSPKGIDTIQRVHLDNIGQKAFDCPDYAGDKKLEACLNDTDRLAPGDSGPTVASVQNGLLRDGADLGPDGVDGKYGPATGMAVKAFKTKYWTCPGFVDTGLFGFEESTMGKTRPAYPPEFRRQMVELVRAGRSPELAREFEPTAQSIRNWLAQCELTPAATTTA